MKKFFFFVAALALSACIGSCGLYFTLDEKVTIILEAHRAEDSLIISFESEKSVRGKWTACPLCVARGDGASGNLLSCLCWFWG